MYCIRTKKFLPALKVEGACCRCVSEGCLCERWRGCPSGVDGFYVYEWSKPPRSDADACCWLHHGQTNFLDARGCLAGSTTHGFLAASLLSTTAVRVCTTNSSEASCSNTFPCTYVLHRLCDSCLPWVRLGRFAGSVCCFSLLAVAAAAVVTWRCIHETHTEKYTVVTDCAVWSSGLIAGACFCTHPGNCRCDD